MYGEIQPGLSVGNFKLGCSMEEILNEEIFERRVILSDHKEKAHIIKSECINFFFDFNTGKLVQISVFGKYKGKFLGLIGIGIILSNLKGIIEYKFDEEDMDCGIEFPNYTGIYVRTKEWSDESPITHISVYDPYLA